MSLDLIRNASEENLRDPEWMERAVTDLGVYPAVEIPNHLWDTVGGGLGICQFPNQLAPYLIAIGKLGIRSYAEIGIWQGGTLATTVEYLTRFGLERALGIDIELKPRAREYAATNPNVELFEAPSDSPEAAKALREFKPDLVLIDGEHSEEGCRADWQLARKHAKWVAIHDIVGVGYPGVGKVWRGIRGGKQEWIAQYANTDLQNGLGLVKI